MPVRFNMVFTPVCMKDTLLTNQPGLYSINFREGG